MEFITRCPACQIAFRVTATQLKLASGRVRCGACLTIFNAEQHRQDVDPEQSSQQQDEYKSQLEVQRLASESLARSRQNRQQAEAQSSFELAEDHSASNEQEDDWLIHDDMDLLQESEPEPEFTSDDLPEQTEFEPITGLNHSPIDPEHRLDAPKPPHEPVVNVLPDGDEPISLGNDSAEFIPEASEADQDNPFTATKAKPKRRRPFTIAACLLALAALPAQYIYFNYDALIQNPQYRAWIEPATSTLNIALPPLVNLDLIQSQHLMVISHPTEPDALLVEAVLINKAGFEQAFPDLLLKFEDVQGVPVAERRFSPNEYLSGELTADNPFPSQRPVRIRLSIVDPGPNATNYQLLISK